MGGWGANSYHCSATPYLDTSVLAPFYWNEALTEKVEALFLAEVELSISHLVEVELISSLSRRVRMGEIAQASQHRQSSNGSERIFARASTSVLNWMLSISIKHSVGWVNLQRH